MTEMTRSSNSLRKCVHAPQARRIVSEIAERVDGLAGRAQSAHSATFSSSVRRASQSSVRGTCGPPWRNRESSGPRGDHGGEVLGDVGMRNKVHAERSRQEALHPALVVENLAVDIEPIAANENVAMSKRRSSGVACDGSEGEISIGSRPHGSQVGTERIALGRAFGAKWIGADECAAGKRTVAEAARRCNCSGRTAWRQAGCSEVASATQNLARPTDRSCATLAAQPLLQIIPSQIVFDFIWSAM